MKKKKTYLDVLESAIKKLWRKYKQPQVIKALHTEVVVEPEPFICGQLNPQIAEFLIELYLLRAKQNNFFSEQIKVDNGILKIIDNEGKLIAQTSSPQIVNGWLN